MAVCLTACKPSKPKGILGESTMAKVLADYHLATELANRKPVDSIAFYSRYYRAAALRAHDLTPEEFDRSLRWYNRHDVEFLAVYKRLADELSLSTDNSHTAKADSNNIWKGPRQAMLSTAGRQFFHYSLPADTLIKPDSRLTWNFNTTWFYPEGRRQMIAMLVVHYPADSVAVTQRTIISTGLQSISHRLGPGQPLRAEALLYQAIPAQTRPHIVLVQDFRLLVDAEPHVTPLLPDSTVAAPTPNLMPSPLSPTHRLRDSLIRSDNERDKQPHFR